MVIETGDERFAIGPAPARRVRLPWGNHSTDFNLLNFNAMSMMRRSVAWSAGNNPLGLPCSGFEPGDLQATLDSVPSSAGITSADTFNQYFNDTMGVNQSAINCLAMVRQSDATYLFDDTLDPLYSERGGFYPIDGVLFGNTPQWPSHNHHFTYTLQAQFTYEASANQFFELATDADAWVFIGTKLAIDLGGIHDVLQQRIDLDRLCLNDGQTYTLRLFMAQRYAPESVLRIHTDLLFETTEFPAVTWAAD
jgi:fibro-slime domain-containing protein